MTRFATKKIKQKGCGVRKEEEGVVVIFDAGPLPCSVGRCAVPLSARIFGARVWGNRLAEVSLRCSSIAKNDPIAKD